MFATVEDLTSTQQRLLGRLIAATSRIPPTQSPNLVYDSRSRTDGVLCHPVLPDIRAPVEVSALMALHRYGFVWITARADGTAVVCLTPLGMDMRESLARALR